MAARMQLPTPQLTARLFGARCLPALTDEPLFEQVGVRIAFTARAGGVSEGPFCSLNLGSHVNDDADAVMRNRALLLEAFDAADMQLVVPTQVHGDVIVGVDDATQAVVDEARDRAQAGADAVTVSVTKVAALLCFADCVPVIIVSPSGRFAVVHAGWRGVMNGIAPKAVRVLAEADAPIWGADAVSSYNVYIGPHIHAECFETGEEVHAAFVERFGATCAVDATHISLLAALTHDLVAAGINPDRLVDAGICTVCSSDEYFSFRAADGVCGRQGALAFRKGD